MNAILSLLRWKDITCYGIIGALFIDYLGQKLGSGVSSGAELLFGSSNVGLLVLLIATTVLLYALHGFSGTTFRHFRHIACYPPLPTAVIIAFSIAPLFPQITHGTLASTPLNWSKSGLFTICFVVLWVAFTGFRLLIKRLNGQESSFSPVPTLVDGKLTAESLKDWLKREYPIDSESHDLFALAPLAHRLLDRLKSGQNTIALQGVFGSGKSSLAGMLRRISAERHEPLIFIQISCWGFDDAAKAQEAILEALIAEMGKEVDTLAVNAIPVDYLDAIGEKAGWLKTILNLGKGKRTPLEQLQRLSPLLKSIGLKVVIFIEDVDRNASPSFDISQIQALLVRFREVEGLSFILSISPNQAIDFSRMCEFVEIMPELDPERSLPLIHRVRAMLLNEHPPGISLDKLEPLQSDDEGYSPLYAHLDYYWPWALALSSLLMTPRYLKHALRRVYEAWPRLCGEVRIDDLIGLSALRVGAPEAYEFFQNRRNLFEAANREKPTNFREEAIERFRETLKQEWEHICKRGQFDIRAAAKVMYKISPNTGVITGQAGASAPSLQSMYSKRLGRIYARRLFTETLEPKGPKEATDQKILSLLVCPPSESALGELAALITDSKTASDMFEEFAPYADFKMHLPLLSKVYDYIRNRYGSRLEREMHPGFFAPWRLVSDHDRPKEFQEWVTSELVKCVPANLHLLNEIYYFWLGTNKHTYEERLAARTAVYEKLKSEWPTLSPAVLAQGFDAFPYVLFHLVFTSDYEQEKSVPFGKREDWAWIGPLLLRAAHESPLVMVPQLVVVLNTAESRGREIPRYEFDEHTMKLWFGEQTEELMRLIAENDNFSDDLALNVKNLLSLAKEKARNRLKGL